MNTLPMIDRETLINYQSKRVYLKKLFSVVAPKYDLITRLMSLNRDYWWKQYLVSRIIPHRKKATLLDIASGTGDIVHYFRKKAPEATIISSDMSLEMLRNGHQRNRNWSTVCNDMCQLPINDNCIDFVTGSYALRNAPSITVCLSEIHRVLKPGGKAFLLDFSLYKNQLAQSFELFLLSIWGSFLGILFHRNPAIYCYIAKSLKSYPDSERFKKLLIQHGFNINKLKYFFFGFIAVFEITKT